MRRLGVWTLGVALLPVASGFCGGVASVPKARAAAARPAAKQPAEPRLRLGVQASYGGESDFGIGARLVRRVGGTALTAIGSFDYFFPSGTSGVASLKRGYWEANGNLTYPLAESLGLYAGAGLNLAHPSSELNFVGTRTSASETNPGLNLLAGVKRRFRTSLRLFGEAKYEIKGGEQLVLSVGILF